MSLQAVDIKYILQHILTSPETLGITSTYTERDAVRYKQYGRYDAVPVWREGVRLLEKLDEQVQVQMRRVCVR